MTAKNGNFSRNLKYFLESTGMKQAALAMHIGLTQSAISQIKNDKFLPDSNTLEKLADVFGTTPEKLIQEGFPFEHDIKNQVNSFLPLNNIFSYQDIIEYMEQLLEAKDETIRVQNALIENQRQQIEKLKGSNK